MKYILPDEYKNAKVIQLFHNDVIEHTEETKKTIEISGQYAMFRNLLEPRNRFWVSVEIRDEDDRYIADAIAVIELEN